MRDGGYFARDGYVGYRDVPSIGGEKCWALMMWEPAEKFGTPYRWYKDNTDEYTDLVTLGQYPYRGRYRVLKKFIHRELVNGEWFTTRMEPTHFILDVMLPMIQYWNKLSDAQKLAITKEDMARDEAESDRVLADARHGVRIRKNSPMVQKRVELMEKHMARAMEIAAHTQRGMTQTGV